MASVLPISKGKNLLYIYGLLDIEQYPNLEDLHLLGKELRKEMTKMIK